MCWEVLIIDADLGRRFKGSDDYVRIKVCAYPDMGSNAEVGD